jgi:hypothetical protein
MKGKKKPSKKKGAKVYSKGQLNVLVDDVVHPLCEKNAGFILLDEALHVLIERNPKVSLRKFSRYTLPEIIKKIAGDL